MLPSVMPDVFIVMLLGAVPDYVQGVAKLTMTASLARSVKAGLSEKLHP